MPLTLLALLTGLAQADPVPVEVRQDDGRWQLTRGGEPFVLNGVGGSHDLDTLAQAGGTSFRTWGVGPETAALLDEAHARGLTVSVGLWLGHERHGFDWSDPQQRAAQRAEVKAAVEAYRDHPAVLLWGLGNEMEGFSEAKDPTIWNEVCSLAALIQELDPHHPVMSTTADIGGGRIAGIDGCEHIDIHGVNSYGGAPSLVERFEAGGGTKPIVLTEYGPPGTWEIGRTSFGAPPELTSTEKAALYGKLATDVVAAEPRILGGYAFLWGFKTEATATWFGLYLSDDTRLGGVDALADAWGGTLDNRAPEVTPIAIEGGDRVAPGATVRVNWTATDPDGDALNTRWVLRREILTESVGGDPQGLPPALTDAVVSQTVQSAELRMPESQGIHRLYAVVQDGKGAGAAASVPILVGEPRAPTDPLPLPWFAYQDHGVGGPWAPSGWMGAMDTVEFDTDWTRNCASPPSCIRLNMTTGDWSGVAWQFPANNWGDEPGGVNLADAKWLKFNIRSARGMGHLTVGVGLIGEDKPHPDSLRVEKAIRPTAEWQEVKIRLRGDASSLTTGLWWILPTQSPATFFIDDVRFE